MLRLLFENIINGEGVPGEWNEAQVTSICKKCERNIYDNYRWNKYIAKTRKDTNTKLEKNIRDVIQRFMTYVSDIWVINKKTMESYKRWKWCTWEYTAVWPE